LINNLLFGYFESLGIGQDVLFTFENSPFFDLESRYWAFLFIALLIFLSNKGTSFLNGVWLNIKVA